MALMVWKTARNTYETRGVAVADAPLCQTIVELFVSLHTDF